MKRAVRLTVAAALALASVDASAHGSVKGLGTFFSGFIHPLLEPSHLVGLIAMALLIGPRWESVRRAELCFIVAVLLGGVWAAFGPPLATDTALMAGAALIGLAVVVARPLPVVFYAVAACFVGLGIGIGSRPDPSPGAAPWILLAGSCLGAVVWFANMSQLVHAMRKPWMHILVRVFGSWVTASSILVLALVVSGNASSRRPTTDRPPTVNPVDLSDLRRN